VGVNARVGRPSGICWQIPPIRSILLRLLTARSGVLDEPLNHDESLRMIETEISYFGERTPEAELKHNQQLAKQMEREVLLKINQELKEEIYTRKHVEAALRESENRYYRLTSICPVGIFRCDATGKTIYMNQRCADMIGLPLQEAMGHGWVKTLHPDDYERVTAETYYAWANQVAYKTKHRYIHADGSIIWVVAEFLNETDESGNFKGFIGTLTNVTPLLQAEEKLRQHQLELEHHARLNMVGEMISGIAHEVNQPLQMIVNYTAGCLEHLQREKNASPQIIAIMQRVFDQAERAGTIIHRLKQFLKKGTLEKESADINSVIRETVSMIKGVLHDAKIDLKLNLANNLPPVFIDKIQIEQVVLNLVHNAVEAMNAAGWLFHHISIQTGLSAEKNQLEIRVSDTGPGIAAEIADHVFDAFFTTKEKGMGVGLSISATILEAHGGRIALDRHYHEGTAFIINLPIEESRS